MARIYISSTFYDLQGHRRAAADALRKLGHTVVAMEDYVAAEDRPLDRVLADVAGVDVYVGIFAWRYGFCPGDEPPSITERELNHAAEHGVPRLLFMLHEDAPWPPAMMDAVTGENESGRRIRALRDRLGQGQLASMFRSPEELAMLVSVATTLQLASRQLQSAAPEAVDAFYVNESGVSVILDSLTAAEPMKVDLGDGTAWWSTRLFVLAALTAEHTPVQQLIFVEQGDHYIGMAPPWQVREQLAEALPHLDAAYRQARAGAPSPSPMSVITGYMQEIRAMAAGEDEQQVKENVTRPTLQAWLRDVLVRDVLPARGPRESDRELARRINESSLTFVPLVRDGRLEQIVDRYGQAVRIAAAALESLP